MRKIEYAANLAQRGFKVFPIKDGAKAPPLVKDWPAQATCDRSQLIKWWRQYPNANIGTHCEGMIVIDVDPKKGGNESLQLLELQDDLPPTLTARTPTGGRHLYYRSEQPVANGVNVLGNGLDIRSLNGYVVAPGSTVPAGDYAFENIEQAVAEAPEWLVTKLGTVVPKPGIELGKEPVEDAPEILLARAKEWLAGQPGAVEGQGGDQHTFVVACELRDLGLSQGQALELLTEHWNPRCEPPWFVGDLRTKVRNAFNYAESQPGSKAVKPQDFDVIVHNSPVSTDSGQPKAVATPQDIPVQPAPKSQAIPFYDLAKRTTKGPGYVVKGLLQKHSYAEFYGEPGVGKTFLALDLGYHVAAGKPWMSHRVHQGPVLYLAFEGTGGMAARTKALLQKYEDEAPLFIVSAHFNLRQTAGAQDLAQIIGSLPQVPTLVIVDTLHQALMGADENSAQDVGQFNRSMQSIIQKFGATVLILHHPGKDASKGPRGSSALHGAVDTEIEIIEGCIMPTKQKDIPLGPPVGFKLTQIQVGEDEDGDPLTSCVVEYSGVIAHKGKKLTGNHERGFNALCALSPNNMPVEREDWKAACREFLGVSRPDKAFYDIVTALVAKGIVVRLPDSDRVVRKMRGGDNSDL
jgi:hypothetical protein